MFLKGIMKPRNFFQYTVYNIQYYYLLKFVESTSVNKSTKHLKLLPPGNSCVEDSTKRLFLSFHINNVSLL